MSAKTLPLVLTVAEVAELVFRISEKSFRNKKSELLKAGFPPPLNLPGCMVWDRAELEAWLVSRRQTTQAPRRQGNVGQAAIERRNAVRVAEAQAKRGRGRPRKYPVAAQVEGGEK